MAETNIGALLVQLADATGRMSERLAGGRVMVELAPEERAALRAAAGDLLLRPGEVGAVRVAVTDLGVLAVQVGMNLEADHLRAAAARLAELAEALDHA